MNYITRQLQMIGFVFESKVHPKARIDIATETDQL